MWELNLRPRDKTFMGRVSVGAIAGERNAC